MPLSSPRFLPPTAVTLGLQFGGGSTGITYGTRSAVYTISDKLVRVQFYLALTAKGSSTGVAAVTGLPIAATGAGYGYGAKAAILMNNATGLPGNVISSIDPSQTIAYLQYQTATGVGSLNDTHFTATTVVTGYFEYMIG